ncbi:MAG: histidine kinase, partial [Oscillospiraceae bacterium]|nr:histidine kinase [Oscillospiraceae bacterium]
AVGRYIVFLIITGRNGAVLKSSNDAYYVEDLSGEKWYSDGLSQGGRLYWPGIYENPARYRSTRLILPISRPVIYSGTRAEIGWHVLAFSPALISDVFEDYRMDSSRSVVVLDRGGRTVFHQDQNMIGQVTEYPFTDLGDGSHFVELDEKQVLVTSKHSEYSGMTLLLIHSLQSLETQAAFTGIVLLVIVTITAAMFLLLVYYLSKRLTKPLEKILDRMHSISGGDFTVDTSIEGSDEMGLIGRGVNEMSANIVYLMGESIKHEQERIELEYQVLLNQINPHFVYNVLNSIKVMADIQKIEGISEMASSLGALLGEISKGTQEQVTIRRELELLDRYLYLQQIRRCGLLTVRYDIPEELKDCLIPRFTLQPLAENAVYHGLDKKDRMGTIDISIREENVDLVVIMLDNGAGIPPERIETLLAQTDEGDKKQLTHVGVSNVDKRVKLFNGGEGGLYIESEEGSYTKVTVWLRKKVH